MFLRPTESMTIYLQQLGRGLRLHEGKAYLTVLDDLREIEKTSMTKSFKMVVLSAMCDAPRFRRGVHAADQPTSPLALQYPGGHRPIGA